MLLFSQTPCFTSAYYNRSYTTLVHSLLHLDRKYHLLYSTYFWSLTRLIFVHATDLMYFQVIENFRLVLYRHSIPPQTFSSRLAFFTIKTFSHC